MKEARKIINFIRSFFKKANRKTVVLGLSGGIDSSLTCLLCSQALGPKNIFPLYLPYFPSSPSHPFSPSSLKKVLRLCQIPQKNLVLEDITSQIEAFRKKHPQISKIDLGNKMVRERMSILYYYARKLKGLVVGTSNLSEILLGYFTLHGDGAWDLAPLAHLYKTEVIKLAKHLNLPQEIINQKPTAGLWPGQTDEAELGFTYSQADKILKKYLNKGKFTLSEAKFDLAKSKGPNPLVLKVLSRVRANAFKLQDFPYSKTLIKKL